jgi:putative CocE/NonD family hydrolase
MKNTGGFPPRIVAIMSMPPSAASVSARWAIVALLACTARAVAAPVEVAGWSAVEAMIPMRDGVKLHTVIYSPVEVRGELPILFQRTPYSADRRGSSIATALRELADDGYILAFQDIRGKFGSEGEFAMIRAPRDPGDQKAIDEGTDAFDTIDWLIKNVRGHNGRVGMSGVSYDGWTTVMALLEPHPALKAASPQASPADMFLGDDFHHNGAFRLSYGLEYVAQMESTRGMKLFEFDRHDTYEWFLALGPLPNADARYFHGKLPTWNDFVHHPNYDRFWKRQAVERFLSRPRVPTLNVAGWWDQEDFYGPLKIYETWEKQDAGQLSTIVVGPWNHGGWSAGVGDRLGPIKFEAPTAWQFREKLERPFFAHYLKNRPLELDRAIFDARADTAAGHAGFPEVLSFRTGANAWQTYDHWPPRGSSTHRLFLHPGGRLAFEPPADPGAGTGSPNPEFDEFTSDPARPVPYRPRPIAPLYSNRQWTEWLLQDQRFAHLRPDVLSFESDPLDRDLDVVGPVLAQLFASTSGTDTDWVIKLIDVYPDSPEGALAGYQLMIANDVVRARFRKSFEQPEPVHAGHVEHYPVDLHWVDHRFKKGHKIMVQIQSTWFPLIDRNPQKYVENPFEAKASDFTAATQRIYRTPGHATHLELPVLKR